MIFKLLTIAIGVVVFANPIYQENMKRIQEYNARSSQLKLGEGPWVSHSSDQYRQMLSGCYLKQEWGFLQQGEIMHDVTA